MADELSIQLPHAKSRDLFFTKQVDQDSISSLNEKIIAIQKNDDYIKKLYELHGLNYNPAPINIYIDSYGGMVYQCFGLLSVMKECRTPIHTIVTGTAMSCGFLIAICGHKRFCYKDSTYMYHQISDLSLGTLRDIEIQYNETFRLQQKIEEITANRTKMNKAFLHKIYKSGADLYMAAQEALKLGCVDTIIGAEKEVPKSKKTTKKKPVKKQEKAAPLQLLTEE